MRRQRLGQASTNGDVTDLLVTLPAALPLALGLVEADKVLEVVEVDMISGRLREGGRLVLREGRGGRLFATSAQCKWRFAASLRAERCSRRRQVSVNGICLGAREREWFAQTRVRGE